MRKFICVAMMMILLCLDPSGPVSFAGAFRVEAKDSGEDVVQLFDRQQEAAEAQAAIDEVALEPRPKTAKKKGLLKNMWALVPPRVKRALGIKKYLLRGHENRYSIRENEFGEPEAIWSKSSGKTKYKILKKLGQGGFGLIYKAEEVATHREVAIKSINGVSKLDGSWKEEIINQRLARGEAVDGFYEGVLNEFVPEIYTEFQIGDNVFIVMELLKGGDLLDYMNDQSDLNVPEKRANVIFTDLVHAVYLTHQNGIAHRDIKFENVMYDPSTGIVRLIDFGLATHMTDGSEAVDNIEDGWDEASHKLLGATCGTPAYMSPELWTKSHYNGQEVDNWALGVVYFTMVSGRFPFEFTGYGPALLPLKAKIIAGEYEWRLQPSKQAKKIVEDLLQLKPARRMNLKKIISKTWLPVIW